MKKEDMIPEETLYPAFNAYLKKKGKYILDENNNVVKVRLTRHGREFLEEFQWTNICETGNRIG
jgi:predicted transcriptional regulator